MLDADGYPLPESLEAIKNYDIIKQPLDGLIDLIHETWQYADTPGWHGFVLRKRKPRSWQEKNQYHAKDMIRILELHTGGWSGNETTITFLEKNHLFWSLHWRRHDAGGHYYFELYNLNRS